MQIVYELLTAFTPLKLSLAVIALVVGVALAVDIIKRTQPLECDRSASL